MEQGGTEATQQVDQLVADTTSTTRTAVPGRPPVSALLLFLLGAAVELIGRDVGGREVITDAHCGVFSTT